MALFVVLCGQGGCAPANPKPPTDCFSLTTPPESTGIAVAILIDNSGSMNEPTPGEPDLPKSTVAKTAVAAMLDETEQFVRTHPDLPVRIAILRFSGQDEVVTVLPMAPFDPEAIRSALDRMPHPRDGTAIGAALQAGCTEVMHAGVFRKHLVVVTDGENTDGPPPEAVGPDIWRKSHGGVHLHFVAFDTDSSRFGFLNDIHGSLLAAGDGATLRAALDQIYQQRILAESEGDVAPAVPETLHSRTPR